MHIDRYFTNYMLYLLNGQNSAFDFLVNLLEEAAPDDVTLGDTEANERLWWAKLMWSLISLSEKVEKAHSLHLYPCS